MKIIIVHHRSKHHASNSGYGRLPDYLDAQIIHGNIRFPYRIAKFLTSFYSKNKGFFIVSSVLKLIELYQLLNKTKGQKSIVHFLNGERDIRHLGFLKRRFPNTFFCATFHKPPKVLKKTISDVSTLKKLDGVIAVGNNQVEFLKSWLQLDNVVYIPHGVDTRFFIADELKKQINTLLFVGQHLRDFDTFNYCIPKIAKKINNLKVHVVIKKEYIKKINPHKMITIQSGISDSALRTLYQKSNLLFLPLLDVTACNSILEAMSCGLPIVTTDVGGNSSYLEGTDALLAPSGSHSLLIKMTVELLKNVDRLNISGSLSRDKSFVYDWSEVVKQLENFYKKTV